MRKSNSLTMETRSVPGHSDAIAVEFVVDGRLLLDHVQALTHRQFGLISPLGWTTSEYERAYAGRLLLREPSILPSGRRELLVCTECADVGCGCISADVRIEDGYIIWSALGYENNYDPDSLSLFPLGMMVFDEARMTGLLSPFVANGASQGK